MDFIIVAAGNPLSFLSDFGVEWKLLVSQGLSFALVAAALYWFVFKPVIKASNERQSQIQKGLDDAEEARRRLEQAEKSAEEEIAKAVREASKILGEARDNAKAAIDKAAAEASAKAAEIRAKSDEQIESDRLRMKSELKEELSELVAKAAIAVVGSVLTDEQRARLSEDAANKLKEGQ